jgi:hypothetical protein
LRFWYTQITAAAAATAATITQKENSTARHTKIRYLAQFGEGHLVRLIGRHEVIKDPASGSGGEAGVCNAPGKQRSRGSAGETNRDQVHIKG